MNYLYTDGSNSMKTGFMGWAITGEIKGNKIELCGWGYGTNQKAELTALIRAIMISPTDEETMIYSDSMYSINAMITWRTSWESKGYINSSGGVIVNKDLIIQGHKALDQKPSVRFEHVRGHTGIVLNERADVLAKSARFVAEGKVNVTIEEKVLFFGPFKI